MKEESMLEIKEAVAVITGAGGGIGEALAQYWVGQGGKVVLADVSAEGLSRVASDIKARGGRVVTCPGDVTREAEVRWQAWLAKNPPKAD